MKNLNKVLSVLLAGAMATSLLGTAIAADSGDYKDFDEITNTEAVSVLSALGVINGQDNGDFNPTGKVTRGEMAKMITMITLGNVDVTAFEGVKTDLTDNTNWAKAYVNYCYSEGIIAGKGNNTFAPTANVTAAEAAKMLLVAMGYNAEAQNYVGEKWMVSTIRDAQLNGLFENLSVGATQQITRDQAAQMIYNAIQATRIVKTSNVNRADGSVVDVYEPATATPFTLMEKTFNAVKEYGYMDSISYDSVKGQYTYTVDNTSGGGVYGPEITKNALTDGDAFKSADDYSDLFAQRVAVIYNTVDDTVYGIYSDAEILAETVIDDVTDTDGNTLAATDTDTVVKFGDTKVKLSHAAYNATPSAANATFAFEYNNEPNSLAAGNTLADVLANKMDYNVISAIDNNDDGKADIVVYYPATAQKVTYVGSSSITAGGNSYTYNKEDKDYTYSGNNYVFPEGTAKGDYVLVPGYGISGTDREIVKVEKFSGEVTATKTNEAKVGDTWFKTNTTPADLGNEYDFWAVNGYLVGSSEISAASKDVLVALASETSTNLSNTKAKVMFADGTIEVIEASKVDGTKAIGNTKSLTANSLYTYIKKSDGTYEVTAVSSSNKAGYETHDSAVTSFTAATSSSPAKLGTYLIADNAVIVVKDNDGNYTSMTGAELKKLSSLTVSSSVILASANGGMNTVQIAMIVTTDTNFAKSSLYGYVITTPYKTIESNVTYYNYDVWTENGTMTIKDTDVTVAAKGRAVKLTANTDGTYTASSVTLKNVAVTGYSESDNIITLNETSGAYVGSAGMSLEKATVLFADTKDDDNGIEGGSIELAETAATGGYIANAFAYHDGTDLVLLIVDTDNNLNGSTSTCGYTVSVAGTPTGATVTADKTKAVEGEVVTLTVTTSAAATSACSITVTPSGTNVDTTAVTITVPSGAASGTVVTGEWTVKQSGGAISGAITLTATGTVS